MLRVLYKNGYAGMTYALGYMQAALQIIEAER